MHPILFLIPQIVVKALAVLLWVGGLLGLAALLLPEPLREKLRFVPKSIVSPVVAFVAGLLIVRLAGHSLAFFSPATYRGDWTRLPIYSYGVMLGTSLFVGWYISLGLGERDGLPRETMGNCYVLTAIAALVGARLLFVLVEPDQFHSVVDVFKITQGGIVAYGGFLGGLGASWWYMRREGISLLAWADVASPSLGSGLAITRIGCYLYGCDFGRPLSGAAPGWLRRMGTFPHWTNPAWGEGAPAFVHHLRKGLILPTDLHALPVHPTEIYESIAGVALFGLMMWVRGRRRFRGEVFLTFAIAYAVVRFAIEMLRDDPQRGTIAGLSTSQFIGVAIFPLALWAFIALALRAKRDPALAMSLGPAIDTPATPAKGQKKRP